MLMRNRSSSIRSALVGLAIMFAGVSFAQPSGRLVVSLEATPPHLDLMSNTSEEVLLPGHHIYETLFAFDAGFLPTPMLVDTWTSDDEGTVWSFTLRKGVVFHNGAEMTTSDVAASYNRWAQVSRIGRTYADVEFEIVDDYSFRLVSASPKADLLYSLSNTSQAFVIIPADVANAAGANELTDPSQWIGTGPFQFVEMVPDEYVLMRAFPNYASRDEPPTGYGGGKEALVAELEFRIIKDVPTRSAVLRAGEIDVIPDNVSDSDKSTLDADPNIEVQVIPGSFKWAVFFNATRPFSGNRLFRQAVAAALDHEELALAMTGGDRELFDLNPGLAFRGSFFYSDAAGDSWNQHNLDRARELLEEAGYNGEELVIISTKSTAIRDRMTTVMHAQLQAAGINVRVEWYDQATLRDVRAQPDKWDILPERWGTTYNPGVYAQSFSCAAQGWQGFCEPELDRIFERAAAAVDPNERKAIYAELQTAMHTTYVPQVLVGDFFSLRAFRSNVVGVRPFKDFRAWGVSKAQD